MCARERETEIILNFTVRDQRQEGRYSSPFRPRGRYIECGRGFFQSSEIFLKPGTPGDRTSL